VPAGGLPIFGNSAAFLLSRLELASPPFANVSRRTLLQLSGLSMLGLALPIGCETPPRRSVNAAPSAAASVGPSVLDVPSQQDNHEKESRRCDLSAAVLPIGTEVDFDDKDPAFVADRDQFEPKRRAQPGDWLARFNETGLTFGEYVAQRPTGPRGERRVIVLQPLGAFTRSEMHEFARLAQYTEAFFCQPVRIAAPAALPRKGQRSREDGAKRWVQHYTHAVLEMLADSLLPNDAICTLGVTMVDLYPQSSWNYVFGEATLSKRVGIYSLARYRARFWGEPETPKARRLATLRSFKVLAHEAGHMFSLVHCRRFECLMNGSNSLDEMDRAPIELCPVCLKMLQYNLRFDVRSRYRRLAATYERANLVAEHDWVAARLARIGC
jgi:archaemetzincin